MPVGYSPVDQYCRAPRGGSVWLIRTILSVTSVSWKTEPAVRGQMSLGEEDDISVVLRYESLQLSSTGRNTIGVPRDDPELPSH